MLGQDRSLEQVQQMLHIDIDISQPPYSDLLAGTKTQRSLPWGSQT